MQEQNYKGLQKIGVYQKMKTKYVSEKEQINIDDYIVTLILTLSQDSSLFSSIPVMRLTPVI